MDKYLTNGLGGSDDNIGMINADTSEFFLLAANNDQPPENPNNNLVDLVTTVHQRLADRDVTSSLKIYDNWMSPESGHQLFERVIDGGQDLRNQSGYYFYDVIRHLNGDPITESTVLIVEPGDFNSDGVIDADDIDLLCDELGGTNLDFDVNNDGMVNSEDADELILVILLTESGDADLIGGATLGDLGTLAGNFTSTRTDFGWADGDFNWDGVVTLADLGILAANFGPNGPISQAAVEAAFGASVADLVPEPAAAVVLSLFGLMMLRRNRSPMGVPSGRGEAA